MYVRRELILISENVAEESRDDELKKTGENKFTGTDLSVQEKLCNSMNYGKDENVSKCKFVKYNFYDNKPPLTKCLSKKINLLYK